MKRTSYLKQFALICLLLQFACIALAEDLKKIHPTGYVSDLAGVVQAATKSRLEALCTELEQKTGAQMAIVTVHSLEGESVENYAVDLYKQLGIGSKKDDRGVLLLVSPDERKYRIEVGYGLEPVINDARAGDVGRSMVPFLREGNYSGAIETAAWQLAKYIADDRGVTLSGQPPARPVRQPSGSGGGIPIGFIIAAIIIISLIGRGSGGGSGWWIWPLIFSNMSGGGRRDGGGWGGSSWGGGFGGGGDSGGGGFGGFGGGSSGGGGASGSW